MAVVFENDVLKLGRDVLIAEAQALLHCSSLLDHQFEACVRALVECEGKLVVTGVGKSGHVARKIAATFASTGTPAFFVHAGEAGHGDLGMITAKDILLAISNSGETEEVINFVSFAKRYGVKAIGMTGNAINQVAKLSDWQLNSEVLFEACPLGVAPTSSTTVQLALGDALAMCVLALRGFSKKDFAKTHPLGSLGRKYFLKVADIMEPIARIPHCESEATLQEVLPNMAIGRMGAILVVKDETLCGIFTDSDLRRLLVQFKDQIHEQLRLPIQQFMTASPLTIETKTLASDALRIFEAHRVSRVVCLENNKPVGILSLHNLLDNKVS
jgi:arabinose-5-phosphate isomerase